MPGRFLPIGSKDRGLQASWDRCRRPGGKVLRNAERCLPHPHAPRTVRAASVARLDPALLTQGEPLALRQTVSKSAVIDVAVVSFLSGDTSERMKVTRPGGPTGAAVRSRGSTATALSLKKPCCPTSVSAWPPRRPCPQPRGTRHFAELLQSLGYKRATGDRFLREPFREQAGEGGRLSFRDRMNASDRVAGSRNAANRGVRRCGPEARAGCADKRPPGIEKAFAAPEPESAAMTAQVERRLFGRGWAPTSCRGQA